ncbi:hypothetical protein ACFYTS_03560 [Nocardia sp. NPDC004151]|uniref:hypothetical protein n=1 Tax=Nocardia sp. NPDC004151 TaxID=3364304 RepID=UPI00367A2C00
MLVELLFAAATVILCVLAAVWMTQDEPVSAARHGRDRYSVAAIRARIEAENRAESRAAALTIRPVGRGHRR